MMLSPAVRVNSIFPPHLTNRRRLRRQDRSSMAMAMFSFVVAVLVVLLPTNVVVNGFSISSKPQQRQQRTQSSIIGNKSNMDHDSTIRSSTRTIDAPTREKTDKKQQNDYDDIDDDDENYDFPNLEYAMDPYAVRGDNDPFHILLLGSTFEKPKITINYVSMSLQYVLGMPTQDAQELSQFAKDIGMSCLGTWTHSECITLGKQLQVRDIVCRVVPYCDGGSRGWQMKDASSSSSSSSSDN